ncbi:MAG: acyltransferase family protein [Methylophilaceae bacterium]
MLKDNNIGFLRLLFAYFVILSHSPQMIDGNAYREIIFMITKTVDLGELALQGFFLISGYLICQSYENSRSFFSWLIKRILRIYPAFIVVWCVCVFVVAPLAGGWQILSEISNPEWFRMVIKVFALSVPHVNDLFLTTNVDTLNGSLWTIRYEFLCYLIIPLIAFINLSKKNVLLALLVTVIFNFSTKLFGVDPGFDFPFPFSSHTFSWFAIAFIAGMCFYKFRESIIWNHKISITCLILLITCLQFSTVAALGFSIFGGYLLFNFAFNFKNAFTQKVGQKYDISYGVYIYAWPIQTLIIQSNPAINPWVLSITTIVLVSILGLVSWVIIEKPFMRLKKYLDRPSDTHIKLSPT